MLDSGVAPVTIFCFVEAGGVFAPFSRVALSAYAVHRHREVFVSLFTDASVRHRAGFKALHDFSPRLDLFDWNRVIIGELEQASNGQQSLGLLVDALCIGLIGIWLIVFDGFLQMRYADRVKGVLFAVSSPAVVSSDL